MKNFRSSTIIVTTPTEFPDYACQIFHDALSTGHHTCFLRPDSRLPMMYIDDCLRSVIEMLEIPDEKLRLRTYNINAMSFTPEEIGAAVRKVMPDFTIDYKPDSRQAIGKCLALRTYFQLQNISNIVIM